MIFTYIKNENRLNTTFNNLYFYKDCLKNETDKDGKGQAQSKGGKGQAQSKGGPVIKNIDEVMASGNAADANDMSKILAAAASIFSKEYGNMSMGIKREIERLKKAQVPWQRTLQNIVTTTMTNDDYTYARPNYRHVLADEYVFPSLWSEKLDELVVAIDTSGSISSKQLTQFISEIAKIHSICATLSIFTCDCEMQESIKTRNIRDVLSKLHCRGGGGTDFRPVFNEIKKQRKTPPLVVFFTDGCGDYPEKKPPYPVLWVLTKEHSVPPWGIKCYVNE